MNKAILIGNVTKDIELTTTTGGVSVCKFTLAIKRKFKNANDEYETDFLNIVAWRNLAENCSKYLKKGNKCAVLGEIQTRSYDAQDGSKKYVTEIIANEVEFLNSKNTNEDVKLIPTDEPIPFDETKQLSMAEDDTLPF